MTEDRVQITPGYGAEDLSPEAMEEVVGELWLSQRFRELLEVQRRKHDCDDACFLSYQFRKSIGGFDVEVLACSDCRQIVVNVARVAAA